MSARPADNDRWRFAGIEESCASAIQALASQAEQCGQHGIRNKALDMWDALIELGLTAPAQRLDHATEYGIAAGMISSHRKRLQHPRRRFLLFARGGQSLSRDWHPSNPTYLNNNEHPA